MELVKQSGDFSIFKKRNGRFGVKNKAGKWVNAEEKVKVLLAEGLIKASVAAAKEEVAETVEEAAPAAE